MNLDLWVDLVLIKIALQAPLKRFYGEQEVFDRLKNSFLPWNDAGCSIEWFFLISLRCSGFFTSNSLASRTPKLFMQISFKNIRDTNDIKI